MKTQKNMLAGAFIMLTLAASTFSGAIANDDQYLNSEPIDINGYVKEAPVSDHELESVKNELQKQNNAIVINKEKSKKYEQLSRSTEKLADVTEDLIEERKESQKNIDKYNKKIDCLMNEGRGRGCEKYRKQEDIVRTQQAAPAKVVTRVQAAPATGFGSKIKIIPYAGLATLISENENLEASISTGVSVESDISSRFSVGLGFNYTTLTTNDYADSGYANSQFGNTYQDNFGAREIEYKTMNFDIYGKFFFTKTQRFRPYIGAGLGYNRSTMDYTANNTNNALNSYGYNFGSEEVTASFINIDLSIGSEVSFTEMIGMNMELAYSRGIGGNLSSENGVNVNNAPDQARLEDFSAELGEANILSVYAGMLIAF